MNNNIASLLTNVYEIEGLLLVVTRHGQDTPSLVYKRIQKAAQELHEQCQKLDCGNNGPVLEDEPAQPAPAQPEPAAAPAVKLAVPDEPAQVPVEDREPDEDITFEFIYDEEQEVPAPDEEVTHVETPQPEAQQAQKETVIVPPPTHQQAEPEEEPLEETVVPVRRDPAKDLRKSLSLNDYYRFRRELFQGDETAMNEALDLIQEMHSAADVEDYFLGELEWDRDSDDVKYFLEIVRNHFA